MTSPKSPRKEGSQEDHKEERFFVIFVSLQFNAFTLLRFYAFAGGGRRAAGSVSIHLPKAPCERQDYRHRPDAPAADVLPPVPP